MLLTTLPARPIPVDQPTPAQPQRVPETPRDSAIERGWVVQVLAGPALTYRTLGAAPAGSVSRLERPALAYEGQLQVGYSFSSRLLVTAGLGYAEYATRLKLQLQNDSVVQAVRSRDVYRFLQVPVQVRYWVGEWGVLRYGVVGGATLNVLLGGRTTEGVPCACEQQPITSKDSTAAYRSVGLSVHVGAQAAYRLNARWSLLVQPSFQYFLTPTTQLGTGLPRRRPWGAALQAGVSLDLP
ncbi:outer membrane beta-barrel protein [Hymenobacter sp. NBH84]|uniref:outer membrane beta-barrel protein n=1 Tax=Hymenobacter sp. NBH84 TaxID=2596915 RepID=UPI0016283D3D|nr:outer membrane beta-barrel protein [Hymenobacter sp. NBH84]